MEEVKRRQMVRNPWPVKKFYLRSRNPENPREDFILEPGATVEALDEAEEKLLTSMSLIDVEKESPAIASLADGLRAQLAEEKAKNEALKAEKEALEAEVGRAGKRTDARPVKR
jgi:hypothetical protein